MCTLLPVRPQTVPKILGRIVALKGHLDWVCLVIHLHPYSVTQVLTYGKTELSILACSLHWQLLETMIETRVCLAFPMNASVAGICKATCVKPHSQQ